MTDEIQRAKQYIEAHGYQVESSGGILVVNDPTFMCGQAGLLVAAGYKKVLVRSYSSAIKFIMERV